MKRKAVNLILFVCLLSAIGKAQNVIRGTVTDSLGNFLQSVTVSVIDVNTKGVAGYYITAANGRFEIQVPRINNTLLRVSSIGYKTVEKNINKKEFYYAITLYAGVNTLPEVVVKTQNLVTGKGDTLNYNVQQFIKPQDRTIGDVIKNLPGITIDPTGTISYNGKAINKFYIDGDDLLGEKYVLGTSTLPADVVTTVQVLENHQPVKMFENRVFSESAALNIKLTSSAKLRVFGSGNIAGGLPVTSIDGRVNTLSFKKKLKFINTYAYNSLGANLGSEVATQNTSLPWQATNGNTLRQIVGFTRLPDPILPYRYFTNNNTHLGSLNSLIPVSKEGSLRFNLSWLPERNRYDTRNTNVFYLQADTIKQFESQISTLTNNSLLFNATYLLNAKNKYIQNKLLFEQSNLSGSSAIANEKNQFTQNLNNSTTRLENMFSLKKILTNENFFELTSNLKYVKSPQNLNIAFGLYPWLLNNNIIFNRTSQFVNQQSFSYSTEGSLSKKIKQATVSLKAEHLVEKTNYTSWLNLLQTNNETKKADSIFQNQLTFLQQRLTLTPLLEYKKKNGS